MAFVYQLPDNQTSNEPISCYSFAYVAEEVKAFRLVLEFKMFSNKAEFAQKVFFRTQIICMMSFFNEKVEYRKK